MLNFYRKAIGIRQGNAALKTGSVEVLEASGDVLTLMRVAGGETVTCMFNFGLKPVAVPVKGELLLSSSGGASLEARGFAWMRVKN